MTKNCNMTVHHYQVILHLTEKGAASRLDLEARVIGRLQEDGLMVTEVTASFSENPTSTLEVYSLGELNGYVMRLHSYLGFQLVTLMTFKYLGKTQLADAKALADRDLQISQLTTQLSTVRTDRNTLLEAREAELGHAKRVLSTTATTWSDVFSQLLTGLAVLHPQLDAARTEARQACEDRNREEAKVDDLEHRIEVAEEQLAAAKERVCYLEGRDLHTYNIQMQHEIARLKGFLHGANSERDRAWREVGPMQHEITRLKGLLHGANSERDRAWREVGPMQHEITRLKGLLHEAAGNAEAEARAVRNSLNGTKSHLEY